MGNFLYKSLKDIQREIQLLSLDINSSENTSILFNPVEFQEKQFQVIPNRIAIHPMEGFDASNEGHPTEFTHERYRRFGKSGAGIVWFEAVAVVPEGRSNPHQLCISKRNIMKFKSLVKTFTLSREELGTSYSDLPKSKFQNPLKILQLTHSGRYSKPSESMYPLRATKNSQLDAAMHIPINSGEIVTDEYLESLQGKYLDAIGYAQQAGFDGVDIKSCHGYLISELLGSYSRKNSQFGGELIENRSRFLSDIIRKASQLYPDMILTLRINLFDALPYPYGFNTKEINENGSPQRIDLQDLHTILKKIKSYGVKLVSFSAGNPYFKPYLSRPFTKNAFNGLDAPEHPLKSIERILGCLREISEQHQDLIIIGTAFSWLRQFSSYIAAGEIERRSFDIIGFGRMSFAHPQFPIDIYRTGTIDSNKVCISCSKCTEMMRMGTITGCVVRNSTYSKEYRQSYKDFKHK